MDIFDTITIHSNVNFYVINLYTYELEIIPVF